MDSNERSQFQARELKSVYVDDSAQFLRIVLHKCHVNRYNIVNQVGLIALHCSGEVLGPDLAVGPPPPHPALARNNPTDVQVPAQAQKSSNASIEKAPSQPNVGVSSAEQAQEAAQAAADEMRFDARTLERIKSLTVAKQRAVESEDYEEAKRCKEMLARLRQTGQLLRDLEERKRLAVQNEDYDQAKSLKVEIERLRSSLENPQQAQTNSGRRESSRSRASPVDQAGDFDGRRSPEFAVPPQTTAPRGAHQPVMNQAAMSERIVDHDMGTGFGGHGSSQGRLAQAQANLGNVPSTGVRGGTPPNTNAYFDDPSQQGPPSQLGPPAPFEGGGGYGDMPSRNSVQSPPLHGARQGSPQGMQDGFGNSGGAPNQPGLDRDKSSNVSEAAHHLRGVPNVEEILTSPEALTPALEGDKECQMLVQLFGEYIARCIYSKTWNLRDAAVQKLGLDLREGARGGDDPNQLLHGYAAILRRTVADKNVQVSLSSGGLIQAVCQVLLENGVRRNEAQSALDSLIPLLVDRLGEPNTRIDKTARDALLDFAKCQTVGALFITQYLLKPPKKKTGGTVNARVYTSRLIVLTALASEFGLQPDNRDGVPLESTAQLAMEWYNHRDGEVRENSIKFIATCYSHVGLRRIEGYLANLRPAQREAFDAEFERMSGGGQQGHNITVNGPAPTGKSQAVCTPASRSADPYALPAPSVPPPRGGGNPAQNMQEPLDEDDELEEFTCQFCGRQDPSFTPEALDVHYWRDCPMLCQCEFCDQVIEISQLRAHMLEECEKGAPAQAKAGEISPHQCPLCRADVRQAEDQDWREHLLAVGCPCNPRNRGIKR
jgi:centrosomal protein CEP104